MATKETWQKLKYFRPVNSLDKWGDPDAISDELLLRLDDFRRNVGVPVYVLKGVATSGHKDRSYHYAKLDESGNIIEQPCAVDIVLPGFETTPFDLVTEAARFGFTGIGYYPHWRWNGKRVGGLHLDTRKLKLDDDGTLNYRNNRWMGIQTKIGLNSDGNPVYKQQYIALNFHNLLKYTKEL